MIKKRTLKKSILATELKEEPETKETEEKSQKRIKLSTHSTKELDKKYTEVALDYSQDQRYSGTLGLVSNSQTRRNAVANDNLNIDSLIDGRQRALENIEVSIANKEKGRLNKIYKGENGYTKFTEKSEYEITKSKITGSLGPIKAPSFLRATCRFDYNPSLCKDYHDTGYCCFGDSCVFLHDRGDYKAGWEMDLEYEKEQKRKAKKMQDPNYSSTDDEIDEEFETLATKKLCGICGGDLKSAVETPCFHLFCEKCALEHQRENNKCYSCSLPTNGIFNDAKATLQRHKDAIRKYLKENSGIKRSKKNKLLEIINEEGESKNKRNDHFDGITFEGPEFISMHEEIKRKKDKADRNLFATDWKY